MTDHLRPYHIELELVRVSTRGLRPFSRAIEARLPSDRSERLSLFPGWESPERYELLSSIVSRLDGLGLAPRSLLTLRRRDAEEVATGDDARSRYLAGASGRGVTWPGDVLICSGVDDRGVVLAADFDRTTLFMDSWGPDAGAVCDDVFELVWNAVRRRR